MSREWEECDKDSLEDMESTLGAVLDLLSAPKELRSCTVSAGYERLHGVAEAAFVECQHVLSNMGPRGF